MTRGELLELGLPNRCLFNVPPGTMKSLLVNVFWPSWEWGPAGKPHLQYISTSYREDFCKRDSRRMRALVESDWYRELWPLNPVSSSSQLIRAGESSFENGRGGWRQSLPFSSLTGGRADRLLIDDPHSVDTAESDVDRQKTEIRLRESASQRLNDPISSAIVMIMQRLHMRDLSAVMRDLGLQCIDIVLPMEFEVDRKCRTPFGEDPRTREGELLFPDRFPPHVIERDRKFMTAYGWAGQMQQRPSPRAGGMFKRAWFADRVRPAAPPGTRWVRHWDLAASMSKTAARTAGVKLGRAPDGGFWVGHVITTRSEGAEVRRIVKATAEVDGKDVAVSIPQDPGQAAKVQIHDYLTMLAGFTFKVLRESNEGDKEQRAEPFAAQCEFGNVYLVQGEWNESFVDELCSFPTGKFKDQVDASSGAFIQLTRTQDVPMGAYVTSAGRRQIPGQPLHPQAIQDMATHNADAGGNLTQGYFRHLGY